MSIPSPDQDQPGQPEAVTIPTRTPFEQQILTEELATIERGRDTLRAIEATLLECAQTPQDKYLAKSAILRLEAQRGLYKKAISNVLEYSLVSTENHKPNFMDALRSLMFNIKGAKPIFTQADRFRKDSQLLNINFLIFSQQMVNMSFSSVKGDTYLPSDQYLTRVISALTGSAEATLPTVQSPFKPYLSTMEGINIGILFSKYPSENETSVLFSPSALEKIINYTPSPAPTAPQSTT